MRVFKCDVTKLSFFWKPNLFLYLLCNEIEKGFKTWFFCNIGSWNLHSKQLNCFDVRNLQAVMNKSCDVSYGNLWRNVHPSNRPFLLSYWSLKNDLMWKLGLVSNISVTENDLHNIFAFLNFCFSVIWSKNQPMPKKLCFPDLFKFWPKFNKTWLQHSKSITNIDIQVQNAFLLQPT